MANNADWVEEVKRWYFASTAGKLTASAPARDAEPVPLGYEAAYAAASLPTPDRAAHDREDLQR